MPDSTEASLARDDSVIREYFKTGQFGELRGEGGKTLRYAVFAPPAEVPVKGVVVLSSGTRESMAKYAEFFFSVRDARAQGFVVATMDHRGQGFSDKEVAGKVHFNDANDLVRDQHTFRQVLGKHFGNEVPYKLVGHSLGGAVAARLAQQHPDDFGRLVLMSPMLDISTGMSKGIEERVAHGLDSLSPEGYGPFQHAYRPHPEFEGNKTTTSKARFDFVNRQFQRNAATQIDGVTNRWLDQSMALDRAVLENTERLKALGGGKGDVHLLLPSEDRLVETAASDSLAKKLGVVPQRFTGRHELLQAPDATRNKVIAVLRKLLF